LKLAGCLLLVSGALITVAALALLPGFGVRCGFVAAGICVELLGLGALARGHLIEEQAAGHLRDQSMPPHLASYRSYRA